MNDNNFRAKCGDRNILPARFIQWDKNKNMVGATELRTKANVARQIGQRQWRRDDDVILPSFCERAQYPVYV